MAKKEFVGIPIEKRDKDRLKRLARTDARRRTHTEIAHDFVLEGLDRDEKKAGKTEMATSK